MEKKLDLLFKELSMIKRTPERKQQSLLRFLGSVKEEKSPLKRFSKWQPTLALIAIGMIFCLFFLTTQTSSPTTNLIRGENMISKLAGVRSFNLSMEVSSSNTLTYFPSGNPGLYFGIEKDVEPFNGDLLLTAKPTKNIVIQNLQTTIKDVRLHYYKKQSNQKNTLFLKFVFLDDDPHFLYVKDVKDHQWYSIKGNSAYQLQKIKNTSSFQNSLSGFLAFWAGVLTISFLIGSIIKDKYPIIKRTPRYIDKKHQRIDKIFLFAIIGIYCSSMYYFGVVHIVFILIICSIISVCNFYIEIKIRPQNKRHYLIINFYIVFLLLFCGFIWMNALGGTE